MADLVQIARVWLLGGGRGPLAGMDLGHTNLTAPTEVRSAADGVQRSQACMVTPARA